MTEPRTPPAGAAAAPGLEARLAAREAQLERLRRGLSPEKRAALERRLRAGRKPEQGAPAAGDAPAGPAAARSCGAAIPRRSAEPAAAGGPRVEPASFAQERLWFLAQLDPGSPVYNLAAAVRLDGALDPRALRRALAEVVRRHESLRTTFASQGGEPAQVIAPPGPPAGRQGTPGATAAMLPVVDLGPLAGAGKAAGEAAQAPGREAGLPLPGRRLEAELRRLALAAARRPFDLAAGPLFAPVLLRESPLRATLVVTLHHIVTDAWSMGVLVRELAELYGAGATGGQPRLPELPIQYADYARWQRGRLSGPVYDEQLAWWRRQLAGLPPELALPWDRPRPAAGIGKGGSGGSGGSGGRGGRVTWNAGAELAARLRALAQEGGATLFMVLLAAFEGLLGRLAGQDDVAVGSPVAGRTMVETEGLIGFFVNTLVLRLDLGGAPDFRALTARAREATLGAFAHQEMPFERLVAELQPERAAARNPLFQVAFVLQNAPGEGLRLAGLTLEAVPVETRAAVFDLTLDVDESGDGLDGWLDYSRDLFDPATAARLARCFSTLLAAAAAAPDRRFDDLQLLGPEERHQLLREWCGGPSPFPRAATVHGLFGEWARRAPDAVALTAVAPAGVAGAAEAAGAAGDQQLTYGELAARAGRLALELRRWGVGPETPIGVCLERAPRLLVALLAVLEAGGAYLPLDRSYPRERLSLMLGELERDGGGGPPPLLLTEPRLAGGFGWWERAGGRLVRLDAGGSPRPRPSWDVAPEPAPVGGPPASAPAAASADNLAYVLYTSGSTGRPKGVAVNHRAIVRLVRDTGFVRLAPDEVFLQLAPISFDVSTLEFWGPLLNGGRLVLMPPETPTLADLAATLDCQRVTTLWLTSGLFHQMVDDQLDGLRPVRQLLAGGDVVSPAHARRLLAALPGIRLINGFGPTENTTFTCCGPLPRGGRGEAALAGLTTVPIGRPIANGEVFVACGEDRLEGCAPLAPIGVAGELLAAGDGLARGYWRRPELTADRFRPHPFAGAPGERVYHTGDRVRFLADGRLEFLGRLDRQVKVRGFRIEPGEVEAALTAHPAVAEAAAAVVAEEGAGGGKRLVAWLVPRGGPQAPALPPPAVLRGWLRERLPDYMVPQALVTLPAMPLTANGKLDRAALPPPEWGAGEAAGGVGIGARLPRTPQEELLAEIWAQVLGRERVGIDDDFFDLGGHSLLATRVLSRVRTVFDVELPLRRLFEAPTVAALARAVIAARRERGGKPAAAPGPRPRGPEPPLAFAQERLWFLDQLEPGSSAYNLPLPVALHGDLAPAALAAAIAELTRRHETLRTRFPAREGRPWQEIAPPPPAGARPALLTVDLLGLPPPARQPEADRLVAALTRRPFDLARGPLVRWALIRTAAAAAAASASAAGSMHVFACVQHHIITDGWSLEVMLRELGALYAGFAAGQPAQLPPLPLQYADYALWQRELLSTGGFAPQLAFWRQRLGGELPVLALPADRPRRPSPASGGDFVALTLSPALSARVAALARRAGATLFMTLLAAWKALLHRLGGQDDVMVGAPIAGRNRAEIEGLLGFFVNTLVLRTDLGGNPTFATLLARVREAALGAYAHQDLPFEQLVAELQPERNLAHSPLVQVFFNHLNFAGERVALAGLVPASVPAPPPPSKFDLTVYSSEREGSLHLELLFDAGLFAPARIQEMARQLEHLLAAVADPPAGEEPGIDDVSLVTAAAAAVLPDPARPLAGGGGDEGEGATVGGLIAAAARRFGSRPAVAGEGEVWTHAELGGAANRLARSLAAAGLVPGEVVAIAAERRAALAWAVAGTLAARGAFLLLDPSYPPARRAAMLRQAGARAYVQLPPPASGELPIEPEIAAALAELPPGRVVGARLAAQLAARGAPDPGPPAVGEPAPGDLAYVVFTSGSTGEPKAVAGEHAPLCHFFSWYAAAFGLAEDARFSLLGGLGHDPLLRDLLAPLTLGATLLVPPAGVLEQPERLVAWLAEREVGVVHLTPALGQLLAQGAAALPAGPSPAAGLASPPVLPALRLAGFGGDLVTPADVERLRVLAPAARVVSFYGATETPQAMAWIEPSAGELAVRGSLPLPLGRGIDGVELLVRGRRGGWAGVGELGEIAVRTPWLGRGYLGDEELTRERFLPDPAGGRARLYRTGDLGRYRPDGSVEIAGRADRQVKVRGFRVEPAEIEAALAVHPAIAEAAVVAVGAKDPAAPGGLDTWLAAFVVERPGAAVPPAEELRRQLALRLPSYMLPASITRLDRLPLTPNGKLDCRSLLRLARPPRPAPPFTLDAAVPSLSRVPRNAIEEVVAGIWEEVLDPGRTGGRVGADDNFFALGGHSLLGTQVLSRLRRAFGVELPLRRLFETPTVAGLARAVAALRAARGATEGVAAAAAAGAAMPAVAESPAGGIAEPPPLVPVPRGAEPPRLSFAQESLWVFEQLSPGTAAYNMPVAMRLLGLPRVAALAAGLAESERRHEILRTCFVDRASLGLPGAGPVQVIAPPAPRTGAGRRPVLPVVDLSALPPGRPEAAARQVVAAESARPFRLTSGPLWRARLLRLAAADHVLLVVAHHIVCDAWSMGIMAAELGALYEAHLAGLPPPLPALAVQYADYAEWQRRWLAGPALAAQLAWWRRRLAGAPVRLDLPTDRPRPDRRAHRGARLGWELPAPLAAALGAIARRHGATPFMLLLAAFQELLHRHSGQDDLVVGLSIAHRNHVEIEPLIGFFVNLLALRADLSGDPDFRQLLEQVRDTALDALDHQDLPFERLVAELRPERALGRSPLFQVLCTLQNVPLAARLSTLELGLFEAGGGVAHFDLTLSLTTAADGDIGGYLEYDVELFDAVTARRMTAHFATLLAALAAAPERRLSELPLLGEGERQQLREWNDTAAAYPDASCLHELIAAQARRTPEALALAAGGAPGGAGGLSFAELDAAAEHLAERLRGLGIGPDEVAALYLERSTALAIALLAVLKAGGAYLPLDLADPAERLEWVLLDARPRLVLTRSGLAPRLPQSPRPPHPLMASEAGAGASSGPPPRIVCLDVMAYLPPPGDPARPPAALPPTPDNLAYVIYTSGSTGRPKGAMVPHRGVVNYLGWAVGAYRVAEGWGAPVHTPLAFDLTVTSLLGPWLAGRCALLVPEDAGVEALGEALAGAPPGGYSLVKLTPSHLPLLAEQPEAVAAGRTRALVLGGEALTGEGLAPWRLASPATRVINEYGPTEAAVGCCVHEEAAGALAEGPVPIGRPIANVRLEVVDRQLLPAPLGTPGELLIGGAGLARGYLRRPDLTGERFVPDALGGASGSRLYRTGDRVRRRPDGILEYLGRFDDQVKVRGFRVEPGEVQAALASHPALAAAAVATGAGPAGDQRLVAYVVARPGAAPPAAGELRRHLRQRLPEFMVPGAFVPLAALPLTANGKLDRRALPPWPPAGEEPAAAGDHGGGPSWQDVGAADAAGGTALAAGRTADAAGGAAMASSAGMPQSPVAASAARASEIATAAAANAAGAAEGAGETHPVSVANAGAPGAANAVNPASAASAGAPASASAAGATASAGIDPGAPRTPVEAALAGIWALLLRLPRVGIHDNFFELGGDSILSLQVASRARAAGLRIRSRDLFRHQTVAALAAVAETMPPLAAGAPAAIPGTGEAAAPGAGEPPAAAGAAGVAAVAAGSARAGAPAAGGLVPLTPVQRWFFDLDPAAPAYYNHALLLLLRRPLAPARLAAAAARLVECHEALRLRFERLPAPIAGWAGWRQRVAPPGPRAPFVACDLSRLAAPAAGHAITAAAAALQGSLDLGAGPILRLAHFDLGPGNPGRLLIVIHHLAVDGVSWRILLEDLETACDQLQRGEQAWLPAPAITFRRWTERLVELAADPGLAAELPYWLAAARERVAPLPLDGPAGAPGPGASAPSPPASLRGSTRWVTVSLDEAETAALLRRAAAYAQADMEELLLAAVAAALRRWTGSPALLIDLEGHGRELPAAATAAGEGDDLDVSRTVGWFTTIAPVLLDLSAVPPEAGARAAVAAVQAQLRAVPRRGAGYGLLRYLAPELTSIPSPGPPELTGNRSPGAPERAAPPAAEGLAGAARRLAALPAAEVLFNYFGQLDASLPAGSRFALAPEPTGDNVSPRNRRSHRLQIDASVLGGRLQLTFGYSAELHRAATIERLAGACRDGLRQLLAPAAGAPEAETPVDAPRTVPAGAAARAVAVAAAGLPEIESVYPLTPMQEGILFHSRLAAAPAGGEIYVAQYHCALQGALDLAAFRAAWQQVLDRHAVLRTSFHWAGLDRPLQAVAARLAPPLALLDWRRFPPGERPARLAELLARDRRRGFDTRRAPLLRVTLVRLAAAEHHLVFAFHHLLLDGWSMPLLFGELLHCYRALRRGERPHLPPVRPFRDYVEWLRRQDAAAAESFWRHELAGFTAPTRLPLEPRPAAVPAIPAAAAAAAAAPGARLPSDYTRRFQFLSASHTGALQRLARRRHLTLGTLVQAAWALLLARHGGAEDVLFGATSAGRPAELEGAEAMVGLFITTLPVRVAAAPAMPLLPWLEELQQRLARLRELEHCSLIDIQRWSELPRGAALFDSLVIFENYPAELAMEGAAGGDDGGLGIAGLQALQNTNYPLTLIAAMRDDRLLLRLAFDGARWAAPPIVRALDQLARLLGELAGAASPPGPPLGSLSVLGPAERHQLLREWSDTDRFPAAGPPLHRTFEQRAAAAPAAAALVLDDLVLSYGEVDARADRLAAALRRLGVAAQAPGEALVAIALRRSPWLPMAMLAAWKAGAAYLPLDPSYPLERLAFMLADSGAGLLLAEPDLRHRLPLPPGLRSVTVAELWSGAPGAAEPPVAGLEDAEAAASAQPTPGALAYVIYTSGSTGTPKGVMVEHRGLANLVREQIAAFDVTAGSRVLQLASASFDASVSEIWTAWAAGAALVLLPEGSLAADAGLMRRLREQQISVATFPPSLLAVLPHAELPALATLLVAGEAASETLLVRWAPGRRRLLNGYGPTEYTVCATLEPRLQLAGEDGGARSLGRPIANTRIRLLDDLRQPVGIGAAGEICLAGAGLARGYLGRPELTAESFVPDAWSDAPGGRLYRTGDRARWTAAGRLVYLGRRDAQVKVRGVRVETGEVEAALARHPEVRSCAVVARRDAAGQSQLVAYVVAVPAGAGDAAGLAAGAPAAPAAGAAALAVRLRAFLQRALPEAMVPGRFVELPELPRTPSGKLDRRALPDPEAAATARSAPPRNDLERYLAGLWSEILELSGVGVDDDFFQLGGHSLSGAALIGRLQQELGEIVHVVAIYDAPTVGSLAAYLTRHYPDAVAGLLAARGQRSGPPAPAAERGAESSAAPDFRGEAVTDGAAAAGGAVTDGGAQEPAEGAQEPAGARAGASADDLEELRQIVARGRGFHAADQGAAAAPLPGGRRNPPALFVLSPPRSGSTLLRVMLAGHPLLFAPPELELLSFATLAGRRAAFAGRNSFWLEGVVRTLMEIHGCDAAAAEAMVAELEAAGATTQDLYARFQQRIAPRLLVDKTPSYALDPAVLARAERIFDGARYVHLARHPLAMIRSFEEARLDQVFFRFPHRFGRRQLAELIWAASEENILAFLGAVPAERQFLLRFEELVERPAEELRRLCGWLEIDFHPDMAHPYERQASRMTDGIHPWSRMLGDVKFHDHRAVDPAAAHRWRGSMHHVLGPPAAELARRLGFDLPLQTATAALAGDSAPLAAPPTAAAQAVAADSAPVAAPAPAVTPAPFAPPPAALVPVTPMAAAVPAAAATPAASLSPAPSLHAALVPLQPCGERPPLVCIHPAGGDVLCYRELARALDGDRPVYGLQAQGVAAGETPLTCMEEIAERSLAALLAAFPAGPYLLLGWSFGGLVAYELARRLAAAGREVALLAILDAAPVVRAAPAGDVAGGAPDRPLLDAADLLADELRGVLPVTAAEIRALPASERLPLLFARARAAGTLPPGFDAAHAQRLLDTFQAHRLAARSYRPAPYEGRLTLIRAAGPASASPAAGARRDPTLGWGRLAAAVEVHEVPGEHETMVLPPQVAAVAERLRRCLSTAPAAPPPRRCR
jgi:amino acid adenylation domain-containing protein/non-ribosomal peptide synthase protein (TIGR01720 family)